MEQYENLYNGIVKELDYFKQNKTIDYLEMPHLFKQAMEVAEKQPLQGEEKKELAIKIVNNIIGDLKNRNLISEQSYSIICTAINVLGGPMIEMAIMASKKLIEINKQCIATCRAKCCLL